MIDQPGEPIEIYLEEISKVLSVMDEASWAQPYDISPNGKELAFAWNATGHWEIFLLSLEGGVPEKLTSGEGDKVSPRYSPDGRKIAYLRDRDGDENFDILVISARGGEPRELAPSPGSSDRFIQWSPQGDRILFESTRSGKSDIWVVPSSGREPLRLTDHENVYKAPQWSPDGRWIAFTGNKSDAPNNLDIFLIPANGGEEKRLISISKGSLDRAPSWSPDGREIAFISDYLGKDDIGLYSLESGEISWISHPEWEVVSPGPIPGDKALDWSPDGSKLAYLLNRGGSVDLVVRDLHRGLEVVLDTPNGQRLHQSFTPDGKGVLFIFSGPKHPPDLWTFSLVESTAHQLTESLVTRVQRDLLVEPELIWYPSFDGRRIAAFLYRPHRSKRDGRLPALVWVHGGPTWQFYNCWDASIQYMVNRGYVVLAPNVRGSTGFGKEFRDLNLRDWGGGDLKDLVAGADYLERLGVADGDRIGVAGLSYGGYMTLMALTKTPQRWAAGASICGIANLETLYRNTRPDLRYFLVQQIGTPEDNAQFYLERSPINFAERIKVPLLVIQGGADPRVPPSEAEQIIEVLKREGKSCVYKLYPDEGHGIFKESNRFDALRAMDTFFDEHLG